MSDGPPDVYAESEWEHGLRCAQCQRLFTEGMPICQRLESMFEDGTPTVLIVCAECIMGEVKT